MLKILYMLEQMRLTWVSGDKEPQQVQYGDGKSETSQVSTFSQDDMCSEFHSNFNPFHKQIPKIES